MLRRFAELLLISRWPLFLGIILFTMISGLLMLRLRIDPTVESLFVKNSPEYEYYRQYRARYGSDYLIAAAMWTSSGVFTRDNLERLERLTADIRSFPQVERVLSLANASDLRHKTFGVKVVPALEGALTGERSLEDVKRDVLSNELFLSNLISKDGKTANFVIQMKPAAGGGSFIEALRQLLAKSESPDVKFYIAGSPVEQYDFVKLIRRDQFTFVPMITILLVLTTYFIYRSLSCVAVAMSMVFATLLWTFASVALFGDELNLITSLLAPVIMIITVVNAIHFMNLYMETRSGDASIRKSIIVTVESLGLPCFLTHFTTVIGFLSLAVNPVPAIREFGMYAALGTFYSYIISMTFLPLMLPALPYRIREEEFADKRVFNRLLVRFLERLEYRWKWVIIIAVVASAAFSLVGMTRLEVDTNLVRQMKKESPLAVATRFIDGHLTGVYSLGFVFRTKDGLEITTPEKLRMIDQFKVFMEKIPAIAKVNSITTVVKRIHQARMNNPGAYVIPSNEGDLRRYFDGMAASGDPDVWDYVSHDFKEVRLQAQMKAVGTQEGAKVEELARSYIEKRLTPYFDYHMTGNVVLLGNMAANLVKNQMQSFVTAFLLILFLISVFFRSLKLGLLAAIPNLLPILVTYGAMGFLKIELSMATAMISSIVLGMVVDNSIHFIHRFRHEFEKRGHYLQALHHTYRHVGESITVSSLILIAGFATSLFAGFRPTMQFGVLTSLTIFLAVVCTLIALPVWLILLKPFGRPRLFRRRAIRRTGEPD